MASSGKTWGIVGLDGLDWMPWRRGLCSQHKHILLLQNLAQTTGEEPALIPDTHYRKLVSNRLKVYPIKGKLISSESSNGVSAPCSAWALNRLAMSV